MLYLEHMTSSPAGGSRPGDSDAGFGGVRFARYGKLRDTHRYSCGRLYRFAEEELGYLTIGKHMSRGEIACRGHAPGRPFTHNSSSHPSTFEKATASLS